MCQLQCNLEPQESLIAGQSEPAAWQADDNLSCKQMQMMNTSPCTPFQRCMSYNGHHDPPLCPMQPLTTHANHLYCLYCRCDPYTNWLLTGTDMNCCCHSNLTRAVAEFGLQEEDVHDVLNAFMCTGGTWGCLSCVSE